MNAVHKSPVNLPVMPNKYEVARYFGYNNVTWFFRNIFFEDILPNSTWKYEDIRTKKRLPPSLAAELYQKHQIESLN